jgi:hypothetical protein
LGDYYFQKLIFDITSIELNLIIWKTMKSTIILKPVEYNLEALGESWRQGEKLQGSLTLKNHGLEKIELKGVKINLMSGQYKKVKARDPLCFETILEQHLVIDLSLLPSAEQSFNFEFVLPLDCRITDKDGSLYLGYFHLDEKNPTGQLELKIQPRLMIMQFLEIMDNFLRFKIGAMKFAKGQVEVKLTPPASREFGQVDGLLLKLKESEGQLYLEYQFSTKKIEMVGSSMSTEKKISKYEQTISSKVFYIYGNSVNQDGIIEVVNSILKEVKPKLLM